MHWNKHNTDHIIQLDQTMLSIASNLIIFKWIVFIIARHFTKLPKLLIYKATFDFVTKMTYVGDRNRLFDYLHTFVVNTINGSSLSK